MLEITKLRNGVSVVSEKIPYVRSVAFGIWFKAGAFYENEQLSGVSHFLEHLIFKGTKKLKAKDISEKFDALGAELNAFTGKEYTCFYSRLISDRFEEGFQILSHILKEPAFRKKDTESERKVVLEEIAMYEDNPDEQIYDVFTSAIFSGNNLGNVILGNKESIKTISAKEISDYHKRYYTLDNMVVTAAGRIDHLNILDCVHKYFHNVNRKPEVEYNNNFSKEIERCLFKVVKKDTQQAHICLGFPIFGAGSPDRFAMTVLDTILGGSMSSRLFSEIREKRGMAYSVYSHHASFKNYGYNVSYAGTSPSKAADVIKLIFDEYLKLTDSMVPEKEMIKSKEHIKGHLALSTENTSSRMMRIGRALLAEEELLSIDEVIEKIDAVTSEDIQRLAIEYFKVKPTISIIGPLDGERLMNKLAF